MVASALMLGTQKLRITNKLKQMSFVKTKIQPLMRLVNARCMQR
jgi:hypothetical protein